MNWTRNTIIIVLLLFVIINNKLIAQEDQARITIILTDKEGNPKSNLNFMIKDYNDNSLKVEAITDTEGKYTTILSKGGSYTVFFKHEGREWNFNFDVPNKPGRKAYTFKFAISIEETKEVSYRSTSNFDEKKDQSICDVTIIIRDNTGMPLPYQPFKIFTRDNTFSEEVVSDSTGIFKQFLKRGSRYELLAELEGFKFTSYFEITKDIEFLKYVFDIDFNLITQQVYDTTYVEKEIREKSEMKTIIRVINKQGQVESDAKVILEESNKLFFEGMTDLAGEVDTVTDRRKVYEIYIRKNDKTYLHELVLPADETITVFTYIVEVDFSPPTKRKFKLNAYFDTGKADLKKDCFPELQGLYDMMIYNMKMEIEIQGHTDSMGDEKMNQVLSENRAKSVKNWLTERGIAENRINPIGYGETMPCATNKTPQGRQLNRRIEVEILKE
ncbi:OmpA family protein [Bacteroidetes/Chlorobi group bacterium ChocPot_Mid]|nr:MAG: OmpA family protein [Bacteroidetes/Chlorobi group bacterium ChocPot_Mid]